MTTYDPVHLTLNDQPRAILRVMDGLSAQRDQQASRIASRRWLPRALFWGAIPVGLIDVVLGYNYLTFMPVALGMWLAAWLARRALRRAAAGEGFAPHFAAARELIATLCDDIAPDGRFFGHLDLTGPRQDAKLFSQGTNANGTPVKYYRDEWLSLKAKLYDGNMLRLSAAGRLNVRSGFFAVGRVSGKRKWKAEKLKGRQTLSIRLSVNPQLYEIVPRQEVGVRRALGPYTIQSVQTQGGIVQISAVTTADTLAAGDLLAALQASYSLLQRKDRA